MKKLKQVTMGLRSAGVPLWKGSLPFMIDFLCKASLKNSLLEIETPISTSSSLVLGLEMLELMLNR